MNQITPIDAATATQITPPPGPLPGVHFGMPDHVYHSAPALGSGSVRDLFTCPVFYWADSWMNPLREPDRDVGALVYGRALHKVVLEGLPAFCAAFAPHPWRADHPNALDTATEIKAALKACGQKMTGVKAELIARLKEADPQAVIWEDVERQFAEHCAKNGVTALSRAMFENVIATASFIAGDPRVAPCFQGGIPEISVFAEIDGVPVKCRLDYVRLGVEAKRRIGAITDLKTFANKYGKPPERAVISAVAEYRLDIQAALYMRLAAMIPSFIRSGQVYGADLIAQDWIDAIADLVAEDWRWFWCFYQKGAPVNLLRSLRPTSDVIKVANGDLEHALRSYREHMERFGTAWRFVDPIADIEVTLDDLPKWIGS